MDKSLESDASESIMCNGHRHVSKDKSGHVTRSHLLMSAVALVSSPLCELSILGGFELDVGDQPLPVFPFGEKLLAFLAVRSRFRPVRRTALAEELWPDIEPARAAANLRSALWRLPRPGGYQLVRTAASGLHLATGIAVDLWHADDTAQAIEKAGVASDWAEDAAYCADEQN